MGIAAALAVVGIAPDGGYLWHSIQVAIGASADKISPTGGYLWH